MKEDLYDDLLNEKEEKTDFQALFFQIHHSLALVCGKRIDMHWPGLCLSPLPNTCLRSVIFYPN